MRVSIMDMTWIPRMDVFHLSFRSVLYETMTLVCLDDVIYIRYCT